jgi:hypothetical protein
MTLLLALSRERWLDFQRRIAPSALLVEHREYASATA